MKHGSTLLQLLQPQNEADNQVVDHIVATNEELALTYDRVFAQIHKKKLWGICGNAYLEKYHSYCVKDYLYLQRQIRYLCTNSNDPEVEAILGRNYHLQNSVTIDCCKRWLEKHIESLLGLRLLHKDGRYEVFKFHVDELFHYFSIHKPYYKAIFQWKLQVAKDQEQLALLTTEESVEASPQEDEEALGDEPQ